MAEGAVLLKEWSTEGSLCLVRSWTEAEKSARGFSAIASGAPSRRGVLADGGDGMTVFKQGRNSVFSGLVLDSFEAWLPSHLSANGKPEGRVTRVDAP